MDQIEIGAIELLRALFFREKWNSIAEGYAQSISFDNISFGCNTFIFRCQWMDIWGNCENLE